MSQESALARITLIDNFGELERLLAPLGQDSEGGRPDVMTLIDMAGFDSETTTTLHQVRRIRNKAAHAGGTESDPRSVAWALEILPECLRRVRAALGEQEPHIEPALMTPEEREQYQSHLNAERARIEAKRLAGECAERASIEARRLAAGRALLAQDAGQTLSVEEQQAISDLRNDAVLLHRQSQEVRENWKREQGGLTLARAAAGIQLITGGVLILANILSDVYAPMMLAGILIAGAGFLILLGTEGVLQPRARLAMPALVITAGLTALFLNILTLALLVVTAVGAYSLHLRGQFWDLMPALSPLPEAELQAAKREAHAAQATATAS